MSEMRRIKASEIVIVTAGCYSDYGMHGVFRAMADIDPDAAAKAWVTAHPEQAEDYSFNEHQFLTEIYKRGLLVSVDAIEWHLGDYGKISEMDVAEAPSFVP